MITSRVGVGRRNKMYGAHKAIKIRNRNKEKNKNTLDIREEKIGMDSGGGSRTIPFLILINVGLLLQVRSH